MKKIFYTLIFTIFSAVLFFSCATTEELQQEPIVDQPIIEEVSPEEVPEVEILPEIEEPLIEGEQLKEDSEVTLSFGGEEEILLEPEVGTLTEDDLEYTRSIAASTDDITFDAFKADKEAILAIIKELEQTKKTGDVKTWTKLISKDSYNYWSDKENLKLVSLLIPNNSAILRSIDDYFKRVYLPAREGYEVTEIRYNSETEVKAVEVQGNNDMVIYDFKKTNGSWYLSLPKIN